MDEQQGNVIDGTARARNWRRRSKTRPDDVAEAARSDAPKSIASSLLVPADMLADAVRTGPGVEASVDDDLDGPQASEQGAVALPEVLAAGTEHSNPFLAAAAAEAVQSAPRARTSAWIKGIFGRLTEWARRIRPPGVRSRRTSLAVRPRRRHRVQLRRPIVIALGLVAMIALGAELVTQTDGSSGPPSKSSASTGNASVAALSFGRLFSVADPFRERLIAKGDHAHRGLGAPAPRTIHHRSKARIATHATTVAYHYTPAASTSGGSSATTALVSSSRSQTAEPSSSNSTPASQPAATPQPVGPAGPAYVIGSACNPKCR